MNPEEHRARHVVLHQRLDELMAEFFRARIEAADEFGPPPTLLNATIRELMEWSYQQTQQPDHATHIGGAGLEPRHRGGCA